MLVAVDAGNTKVDVLSCEEDGTVLAWAQAGSGDIYRAEGEDAAVAQVRAAIETVLGGGLRFTRVSGMALRLAGVDWPEDGVYWRQAIAEQWRYEGPCSLANDGFAGIRLGFLDGAALAITAGTGIALVARHERGDEFCLGMWGPDDMGAKGLGIAGYRQVALNNLGMAPPTVLSERYVRFFGVEDVSGLVHFFTSRARHPFKPLLASAAPLVTAAALEGDGVACEIVREQAGLLASYARVVADRVGYSADDGLPVVLSGRVLRAPGSPVAAELRRRLLETFPRADIRVAELPAVCGAALDVLSERGVVLSASIVERMTRTMPSVPQLVNV